jgi:hypothetical protein
MRESDLIRAHRDVADQHPSRCGCCTGALGYILSGGCASCPTMRSWLNHPIFDGLGVFLGRFATLHAERRARAPSARR